MVMTNKLNDASVMSGDNKLDKKNRAAQSEHFGQEYIYEARLWIALEAGGYATGQLGRSMTPHKERFISAHVIS